MLVPEKLVVAAPLFRIENIFSFRLFVAILLYFCIIIHTNIFSASFLKKYTNIFTYGWHWLQSDIGESETNRDKAGD